MPSYATALNALGAILGVGSVDYAIVPIGIPSSRVPGGVAGENSAKTTVTTYGQGAGSGLAFTYSSARDTWAGPQFQRGRGKVWSLKFAGPTNYLEAPDAAFWTSIEPQAWSIGAFVNLIAGQQDTEKMIFNKLAGSGTNEWSFSLGYPGANKFSFYFKDQSAAVFAERQSDAALALGKPISIGATYAGTGGATAANGVILYADGVAVASTAVNNASYVAMEDGANVPAIGRRSGTAALGFTSSLISAPGIWLTKRALTAAEMLAVDSIGRAAMRRRFFDPRLSGPILR